MRVFLIVSQAVLIGVCVASICSTSSPFLIGFHATLIAINAAFGAVNIYGFIREQWR